MNVKQFCNRQRSCGRMAQTFAALHPELTHTLIPNVHHEGQRDLVATMFRLISGATAYAEWLEYTGYLGTESWHTAFLHQVFSMQFQLGLLDAAPEMNANDVANFLEMMVRTQFSRFSVEVGFAIFGEQFNLDPSNSSNRSSTPVIFKFKNLRIKVPRNLYQKLLNSGKFRVFYRYIKRHFDISRYK